MTQAIPTVTPGVIPRTLPETSNRATLNSTLRRLVIWLAIFAAWEGAYRVIGWTAWKFPAPSHVADSLLSMLNIQTAFGDPLHKGWPRPDGPTAATKEAWFSSPLIAANKISGLRLLAGFAISIITGAAMGVVMWRYIEVDKLVGPLFLGLLTLPSVCWVPLGVLALGIAESTVLFVLIMGSVFAVAISMRDGLRNMPPVYRRAGLMLGASGWRLYRYVLFPASLPAFAGSLRQGFSFSWRSLLGAELILTSVDHHGLGFLLSTGRDFGDVAQVIAIMIVMVAAGMLADRLVFMRLQKSINTRFGFQ